MPRRMAAALPACIRGCSRSKRRYPGVVEGDDLAVEQGVEIAERVREAGELGEAGGGVVAGAARWPTRRPARRPPGRACRPTSSRRPTARRRAAGRWRAPRAWGGGRGGRGAGRCAEGTEPRAPRYRTTFVGVIAPRVETPMNDVTTTSSGRSGPAPTGTWSTPATATSGTRPPTASPRSRSAGPRCATRSGPRPCSSSRTRSSGPATTATSASIVLTGEGPDAFCSGGDQRIRGDDGYVGDDGIGRLNVLDLQILIRRVPKPVVAMVAGYAIGGGHVLHVVCDLTIAADNARFGQTGPRVGSFDGGYGVGAAGAVGRAEEGARDLVPVPAVRRAAGARHGAGEHRRAARGARGGDGGVVPPDARSTARSRCA